MSWLSNMLKSLSKSISSWWNKNNSLGDLIRNNEKLTLDGVTSAVHFVYGQTGSVILRAKTASNQFIDSVVKPLPDFIEVMIDSYAESQIENIFNAALSICNTEQETVNYIMIKLKALK